jgi:hypothetical protein
MASRANPSTLQAARKRDGDGRFSGLGKYPPFDLTVHIGRWRQFSARPKDISSGIARIGVRVTGTATERAFVATFDDSLHHPGYFQGAGASGHAFSEGTLRISIALLAILQEQPGTPREIPIAARVQTFFEARIICVVKTPSDTKRSVPLWAVPIFDCHPSHAGRSPARSHDSAMCFG